SPGVDVLGKQTARNERQLCPSSSELSRRGGAGDLVAQDNGVGGAVAQQITSRQCTDDVSIRILNTEMAVADPVQAADGTINEGILLHGLQRLAHDRYQRCRKCCLAVRVYGPQQVALRHDADLAGLIADVNGANPLLEQQPNGFLDAGPTIRKQ